MSSTGRVRFVVAAALLLSVASPGTPRALAFTEGASNNFFGTGAGANSAGDNANSFFGGSAGNANTTGALNAFFGQNAGLNNTTGSGNAFFGREAGSSNTTAGSNAFFGYTAGSANTTGISNGFFGSGAGFRNTTGNWNSFFGDRAGFSNTTGCCNSFFGRSAGVFNDTGANNTFFGFEAGFSNTTGSDNAFFGLEAGRSNTVGMSNAFFGRDAGLFNGAGASNAFFGRDAGRVNGSGTENAFFGRSAGTLNTTGNANSFVGALSNGLPDITNATAVGHRAKVSQSNSLVLGSINGVNGASSSVNVGIGTTTPDVPLHVQRTDGATKVLVREASITTLGRELFQLINNGAARFRVTNTANDATWDFQSSGGGGSFVIDRVGGPASLDFEMQPDGDLVVRGTATATSFITSSDRNAKTDITPANARRLMSMLRQLDIPTWRFKNEPEGTVKLGPMAQDFHRLFAMGTSTTIDVRDLAALGLVAAQVLDQDQQRQHDAQQKEIDELRETVANLSR